jgi:carboxypeptidase C (cathepsin A)
MENPSRNPHSFNEYANMIYIDQPISVGFSYGDDKIDNTMAAANLVWKLLQAFYTKFPQYNSRDFGIFTESYGGHFGPGFTKHILDQNDKIAQGTVQGQKINFIALGINNGWIHSYDNYKGMIEFSAKNEYKRLISSSRAQSLSAKLEQSCLPALQNCWKNNTNAACNKAVNTCKNYVETPLVLSGNFDVYDVRKPAAGKWPPQTYEKYLQLPGIQSKIGATKKYNECPTSVQMRFIRTGDGRLRLKNPIH